MAVAAAYPNAEWIVGVFLDAEGGGNPETVVPYRVAYIWIAGPTYLALGVSQILLGGIQGSGSTRAALVFSITELWVLRLPIAYGLLAWFGAGVEGVW